MIDKARIECKDLIDKINLAKCKTDIDKLLDNDLKRIIQRYCPTQDENIKELIQLVHDYTKQKFKQLKNK